jgi:Polysaccharide lyase
MPLPRTILGLLAAATLLVALSTSATAASAAPRPCQSVQMSVSRHAIGAGGWVRVRGRTCVARRHRRVKITIRGANGWRVASRVRVRADGKFNHRVRLRLSMVRKVVHLRAVQSRLRSRTVTLHVNPPASSAPPASCTSTEPTTPVEMSAPGCGVIFSDTSSNPNPLPLWGSIQCANSSRYSYVPNGGDSHPTATGAEQPDDAYRRLTVLNGDEFYGERCELGLNNREGPTAFYHEGQHRVTYFSERLPANFPLETNDWQTVMQMKQAQPSDGGGGGPILEMQARQNKWVVINNWHDLWSFPAQKNTWTRFAWDVYYSQDPSKGWLQVSADLNGDGDFNDPGERSPVIHAETLKTEIEGPNGTSDGLASGDPIPSHLRVGIYHDPAISCAPPTECSVEVDNVQVLGS